MLRLGLGYGESGRDLLSRVAGLAARFPVVPVLHGGVGNQFLLHERCLSAAILRAVRGEFSPAHRVITLAHPDPVSLAELVRAVSAARGRTALIVRVHWRMPFLLLRAAEMLGLSLSFRSDSVRSFVYQDPQPDFTSMLENRIFTVPFVAGAATRSGTRSTH